jgi:hypothetical protein
MTSMRRALFSFVLFIPLLLYSTSTIAEDTGADARAYLETIEQLKDRPVDKQIEGWRKFLSQHPNSSFREEIEGNLKNLEELNINTDPTQQKEKRDTERYLRAVEFAKKLGPSDQILLWKQFLDENPESIYRREAKKTLDELQLKGGTPLSKPPGSTVVTPGGVPEPIRVAPELAYKDPQKALLLAAFPGLIVPGIAHWYTRDYPTAGLLTGLRVGGLAVGIPAIINRKNSLIWIGGILAGLSYIIDVVDAPFTVERYNDALEQKAAAQKRAFFETPENGIELSLAVTF